MSFIDSIKHDLVGYLFGIQNRGLTAACCAVAVASTIAFPYIRRDYQTFLSGGPSYAPQNIRGYIIVCVLSLFRQEQKGLAIYDRLPEKRRWLPDLPPRNGPRPVTTSHIIQRQRNQAPDPDFALKELKATVIPRVQARHTDLTHLSLSKFEFHAEAIFLLPSVPINDPKNIPSHDTVRRTKREIAHMHDYHDYTLHLALAAQDGKEVVSKGWGQRHPLAGPGVPGPPTEWTFIYAPRNEEELAVVEMILEASIGYMTNDPAGKVIE
ncbi:uncharacterized protein EV420DRAFT_139364 [Desarmillaria tabescens]|uniref:Luciferase domain-containing protein n=1 Tax=Armillaria tabescens TaxID=1929756 RepID=A0AA39NAI1_ARMTA|nr:uncharacterized protein EV420DRAFT_139364 [Desarmillaria tabescens]KAK0461974.1 hypothetical protein EV420DRAFT_139364 [Desarmillaria tabescens]